MTDIFIVKSVDTEYTFAEGIKNDPDLTTPVDANTFYAVRACIILRSDTSGVRFGSQWARPALTLDGWFSTGWEASGNVFEARTFAQSENTENSPGPTSPESRMQLNVCGVLMPSASGTFAWRGRARFASGSPNGSTYVCAGSWLWLYPHVP